MNLLHILAGLFVLAISGSLCLLPLQKNKMKREQQGLTFLVSLGLVLGFVLFSGFFQLGSRGTIPTVVLWKLGATFTGGLLSIATGLGYLNARWPRPVYMIGQILSLFLFLSAFYWGWIGT